MALGLVVSIVPNVVDEVISSFGTGALVTGVALLATGYVQIRRQQIAYYQQSIILQMACMGFGPAAIALLRRKCGKNNYIFIIFTVIYAILMVAFLLYISLGLLNPDPLTKCFLDRVSSIYGTTATIIINSLVIGVCVGIIILSCILHHCVSRKRQGNGGGLCKLGFTTRREWCFAAIVFILELGLAVLVNKTVIEYSRIVPTWIRGAEEEWSFAQIIPFMMLIGPIMELLRAILGSERFKSRTGEQREMRQNSFISQEGTLRAGDKCSEICCFSQKMEEGSVGTMTISEEIATV